ncbi:hypothetical protein BO70DRAFT_432552 [Aspergillus heteromorphus CBS 117.55]|uniref:Uncharacterized protein n=1 Tax=Aspergillus heteromorphus CBS 117.55 TaxID=1448321 RepID=A0A317V7V7_9EURO|nr:uncharacterized protein BO70DRAFT_432552 [Aspergillus heteromorphus CBS 117.55]PWY69057.1 hypothetical protein BO70DRAFT_432552 [Aspergillus heteromorphus CBS 117.55]
MHVENLQNMRPQKDPLQNAIIHRSLKSLPHGPDWYVFPATEAHAAASLVSTGGISTLGSASGWLALKHAPQLCRSSLSYRVFTRRKRAGQRKWCHRFFMSDLSAIIYVSWWHALSGVSTGAPHGGSAEPIAAPYPAAKAQVN